MYRNVAIDRSIVLISFMVQQHFIWESLLVLVIFLRTIEILILCYEFCLVVRYFRMLVTFGLVSGT